MKNKLKVMLKNEYYKVVIDSIVAFMTIIATVVAIVAIIISGNTLKEMQIQRNKSYEPCLVFETKQIYFQWGEKEWNYLPEPSSFLHTNIKAYNIGIGVAKNISIKFKGETLNMWIKLLKNINPDREYACSIVNSMQIIKIGEQEITVSAVSETKNLFQLPNAESFFEVNIPVQYFFVLNELYEFIKTSIISIAPIELELEFFDVQGRRFKQEIFLAMEVELLIYDSDDNGRATINLVMQ